MLPVSTINEVLELVATGLTASAACSRIGITRHQFAYAMRTADRPTQERHKDALEAGAEALADGLANIHEEVVNPLMARVVSENRRWLLSKRFSALYGDRHADDDRTADLTAILREAIDRIPRPAVLPDRPYGEYGATIDHHAVSEADVFGD